MNDVLIKNWYATVGKEDLLINCGDFCFCSTDTGNAIISSMPGINMIIWGNHDVKRHSKGSFRALDFDFADVRKEFKYKGHTFVLSHRPIPKNELGKCLNIHGHLHDMIHEENDVESRQHICISVEQTAYKPIEFWDVCDRLIQKSNVKPVKSVI